MKSQERIAAMEKQLQELTKQLAEFKKEQPVFNKGWNYICTHQGWLALSPYIEDKKVKYDLLINLSNHNSYGKSSESHLCYLDEVASHRPATPEEIKNALQEVCKRKGIVPGATIKRPIGMSMPAIVTLHSDLEFPTTYCMDKDQLQIEGYIVYERGQFAEVVKEPEEKITIGGYEVHIAHHTKDTSIQGNLFPYKFWQAAKVVAENSKAAVIVGCSAKDKGTHSWVADLDLINKILKRLEK